jgi:hypothetical protein
MNTEREIIYQILNTIRDAEHNEDERISERLMRSFLRTYRAESLRKYYKDGHIVNDEVFQIIPVELVRVGNTNEFTCMLPKVIRMTNHYGFYLEKNGISIPIVESENYSLSKKNPFGKNLVQSKTEQNKLTISCGTLTSCMDGTNDNALLIGMFIDEIEHQVNASSEVIKLNLDFFGVLHNPDDQPGYDWETDIFPFPSERLPELKGQILAKEFGIMVNAKKDEISNTRNDNISPREEAEI